MSNEQCYSSGVQCNVECRLLYWIPSDCTGLVHPGPPMGWVQRAGQQIHNTTATIYQYLHYLYYLYYQVSLVMVLLLYAACFLVTMFSARERRYRRPSLSEEMVDTQVSKLLTSVETGR